MKKSVLISLIAMLLALAGCMNQAASKQQAVSEDEIGLRQASLYDEEVELSKPLEYAGKEAGTGNKLIARSFENAPPMIPHSVDGLLPITKDNNMCVSCHLPEVASMVGAVSVPASHLYDLRNEKDLEGQLSNARYNCSACHAPQAMRDPTVDNRFSATWRTKEGLNKSNLMEVITDGVR